MTKALLKLEIFDIPATDEEARLFDASQIEEARLAGYEQGYGAGWQDALMQLRDEDALRKSATLEALQDLSFSFHEASASVEHSALAALRAILECLLPDLLRLTLPAVLQAELETLLRQNGRAVLQMRCAPQSLPVIESLLAEIPGLAVDLTAEPSFTDCQVTLQIGPQQRQIDLDALAADIRALLAPSPPLDEKGAAHG